MNLAESYRAQAAAERAVAAKTNLRNRRALHERSAEIWETMALNAEQAAALSAANAAAKVTA